MVREVSITPSGDEFSRRAAETIAEALRDAIASRGRASIALSGGSVAAPVYGNLAVSAGIDWRSVLVFWGDDRFVEPSNPYSNYGVAREALLSKALVSDASVYAPPTDAETPDDGAKKYEQSIANALGRPARFDVIHLGMGPDGHTASLFPDSPALAQLENPALVRAVHAGLAPWVDRLTFTMELINAARLVLVTVSGAAKAQRLRQVFDAADMGGNAALPASLVAPTEGRLIWLLDEPAALALAG